VYALSPGQTTPETDEMPDRGDHDAVTVDQFTKQAEPFASLHTARTDADILRLIREAARVGSGSKVLDVACGPGLVALHLAEAGGQVAGLDITPAMLEKARELQRERGLVNLSWDLGRADALPYADACFDAVVTRFSFHHLTDPAKALSEMVRVVVCDVYTSTPEQAAEYDRLERLRDPSHVHALRLEELRALLADARLEDRSEAFARVPMVLGRLLAGSFPVPGGADEVRRAFAADLGRGSLGLGVRNEGGQVAFEFPVVVLAGTKRS
jgi:SAM-dependent methyltransferase